MESTQVGGFKMAPGGKSKGPPPAVKKVLSLFGSGREEDKMVGYLSFLKIGPKLLKYLPGKLAPHSWGWSCAVGPGVAFCASGTVCSFALPAHCGRILLLFKRHSTARSTPCFLPVFAPAGQKVKDLRTWLTAYSYWNQGGLDNVVSMFLYIAKECFGLEAGSAKVWCMMAWPVIHLAGQGCFLRT
jgi:hypothetical protein